MTRNIVLKFYADWCGPCKTYAPILDEVFFRRSDISLRAINVDQDPHSAFEYGVSTIPALILLKKGDAYGSDEVVGRIDGVHTATTLREKLEAIYGLPE
jgi:thioredoxin 1